MFIKKQYKILILIVVVVAIFVFCGYCKNWFWQSKTNVSLPGVSASPSDAAISKVKTEREKIMADLAQRISEISPVKSDKGKSWLVERFWFVVGSDKDFYAEYQNGKNMRRILLSVESVENGYAYNVVAYFEPCESDWMLKTGKDKQFGKSLDLYEYNESEKSWVKKN